MMKHMIKTIFALALTLLLTQTGLAADAYQLDRSHSDMSFTVSHMMISKVRGSFGDFTVDLQVDPANLGKSSVKAVIQAASITTANDKRDEHLRGEDFFDVAKFPTLTFQSKFIALKEGRWVATGDFTMHGVTKSVDIPFTLNGPIQDPWDNTRIGVEATLTINRQDFGVSYGSGMVGDEVSIQIQLEATKTK